MRLPLLLLLVAGWIGAAPVRAEDGYALWLRYRPLPLAVQSQDRAVIGGALAYGADPRVKAAAGELDRAVTGLLGLTPSTRPQQRGTAAMLGTSAQLPAEIRRQFPDISRVGSEGYAVRTVSYRGRRVIAVMANSGAGVLYGTFALIRELQLGHALSALDLRSSPKLKLRVLDHWDNLDGHIERGYAGQSLWDWWKLPDYVDPRYTDYARADASIGINGVVLNNVNANALSLTAPYIAKTAALADVFRPWGIKVYLSAYFAAPKTIGGLDTADPLDLRVKAWWRAKADEIYKSIPDFGGFLVKANSEGQPGPQDYHRTHADGANMLAQAVAPHGGVVMYRAFVYSQDNAVDRAKQAYDDFKPLDGKFDSNVLVQVKNGPIDFQPREPFHPLFGAMPKTPLMMEFQITKEYLGQAFDLVYLGALFEEVLKTDTMADGPGTTVAKVIEGKAQGQALTGMAGVANVGNDRDWSGSTFNQANWYAFGRLAWDPDGSSREIAGEWASMTFTPDPRFVAPTVDMMMRSREAVVDYMTPLGLHHIMATASHYGPGPWVHDLRRAEWNPVYYHRADASGIGFDRTASGSNAIAQYAPPIAKMLADPATTPEPWLLWFHHLPWDYRLHSGRTLWDGLAFHYQRGFDAVGEMRQTWDTLRPFVDEERWTKTAHFLARQQHDAAWWRDACLAYFQTFAGKPLPPGVAKPARTLQEYEALSLPFPPGR
jgi:alpha-glucuronidase